MGPASEKDANFASKKTCLSKKHLLTAARRIFELRRLRRRYFRRPIFGEPAWDILLVLYIDGPGCSPLSAGGICERLDWPPTITFRWLQYLKNEQLIIETASCNDPRVSEIDLSQQAIDLLCAYLEASLANGLWDPLKISELGEATG